MGIPSLLSFIVILHAVKTVRPYRVCCDIACYDNSSPYDHLARPRCPDGTWPAFNSYTPENSQRPVKLTHEITPYYRNSQYRVIFIIHGFKSKMKPWIFEMKDKLIKQENATVIIVDWIKGAKIENLNPAHSYKKAASTTRVVADHLTRLARHLVDVGAAKQNKLWCIGHSLGAHICGETGIKFKLGRITGLDPAGPHYGKNRQLGLRPESAMFVDVIHTDHMGLFCCGHLAPRGHVDFYPNGGQRQPGCFAKRSSFAKFFTCSHARARQYFIESIDYSCPFYTGSICSDPYNLPASCDHTGKLLQVMGYKSDDPTYDNRGLFYLQTGRVNVRRNSNETCDAKAGQVVSMATPVTGFHSLIFTMAAVSFCLFLPQQLL